MAGTDLTILVAFAAGIISFLSPCVLPLVPAYLGQLTAIAVAGAAPGARPSRWTAMRHALAYVAGFGAVFTILGITATFAAGPLVDYLPALRTIGGFVLIVLGLNLAGILRIPGLERTWRPLDAGAAGSLATATGSTALAGSSSGPTVGDRLGGRVVSARGGWFASFGLGAIFAIGWTPCIGIILGGILTMAKIAPRPNEANHPPRALTTRPPSRSPTVGPLELPVSAVEPVTVASEVAAPPSSGRQVRSSPGMRRMPARFRPSTIRMKPPMVRRAGR